MPTGIYIGRFQPFHQGHYNRIRIALEGYFDKVVPVLFRYLNYGEEHTTYDNFLSLEERIELFRCVGLDPLKFDVEVTRGFIRNLEPGYVWKRREELLENFEKDSKLMTNSIYEALAGKVIFGLPIVYIPKFIGETEISGVKIRELLLQDKIEEAAKYLPAECRKIFIEIVKQKDIHKLYAEKRYNSRKIGPFRVKIK
jgi:nicotinamide mononucleotide adenylyltransferase